MLKTKTTATFLAVLVSAILLGALPSLALVRADSGSDSSGSSSQPTCPDGSTPDSNGNCPNNSQQSQPQQQQQQQQQTCPDGSTPDSNGNCPNNSQQSQPQQQPTCPDGSTPDSNGNCPNNSQSQQSTSTASCDPNDPNPPASCNNPVQTNSNGTYPSGTVVSGTGVHCPAGTISKHGFCQTQAEQDKNIAISKERGCNFIGGVASLLPSPLGKAVNGINNKLNGCQ